MVSSKKSFQEIWLVLAAGLGQSAIYSILAFVIAYTSPVGLAGSSTTINGTQAPIEWQDFTYQFLGSVFQVVPVLFAIYLVGSLKELQLTRDQLGKQLWQGLLVASAIGIPGLGLYLLSRSLGLSVQVIATSVTAHWWTIPMLLLAASVAAISEEFVMIGFIFNRLKLAEKSSTFTLWFSAIIRGAYHLYQGVGGFVGNLVMGLVFGRLFQKTGRLIPLVFAHFALDAVIFVLYPLVRNHIAWL